MKYITIIFILALPLISGCNVIYDITRPQPRIYQVKITDTPYDLTIEKNKDTIEHQHLN